MTRSIFYRLFVSLFLGLVLTVPVHAGPFADFSGKEKAIADYTGDGKWRVVMIWASDCHVCNQEAHSYVGFHEKHKDKDARVLGISIDGKEKIKDAQKFIKEHKVSFPNLIGEPEEVVLEYMKLTGAEWIGTPTFMIYTPAGKLVSADAGAIPVELIEKFISSQSAGK